MKQTLSEAELQAHAVGVLKMYEKLGKLTYERINSGMRFIQNKDGSRRVVRMARSGFSDLILFFSGGATVFVELKAPGKYQNQNQKGFQQRVEGLGFRYEVIKNMDAFHSLLNEYV